MALQQSPRRSIELDFLPLGTKGLQLDTPEIFLGIEHLAQADNVVYEPSNIIRKRQGFTKYLNVPVQAATVVSGVDVPFHDEDVVYKDEDVTWVKATSDAPASTAKTARTGYDFWYLSGSAFVQKHVVGCGGKVYYEYGGEWRDITPAGVTTVDGTVFHFSQLGNKLLICNDHDEAPWYWDGATATATVLTGTGVRNWTAAVKHQSRLWAFGDPDYPDDMSFCTNGDLTVWTGSDAGVLVVSPGDGDKIVGASETLYKRIIVFKGPNRGSVHAIVGSTVGTATDTDFAREDLFTNVRCLGQRCIIPMGGTVMFFSDRGLHELAMTQKAGEVEHSLLSFPIHPLIGELNLAVANLFSALFSPADHAILFSVATRGAVPDTILCFNVRNGAWSRWPGVAMHGLWLKKESTGKYNVLGGTVDGYVMRLFQPTRADDSAGIVWTVQTGRFLLPAELKSAGDQASYLELLFFFQPANAANIQVTIQVDNQSGQSFSLAVPGFSSAGYWGTTFIWGISTWGGTEPGKGFVTVRKPLVNAPKGQTMQITMTNAEPGVDIALYGVGVRVQPAGAGVGGTN